MMTLRLAVLSLLFCISYAFSAVPPEGMQGLDSKTQTSLQIYMSSKSKQGNDYINDMRNVAKESPNICLRYLAAKILSETTGSDAHSIKAKIFGNDQLKAIFSSLEHAPDRLTKECTELKSALASDIIKNDDDPYEDFVTKEINPLFQRDQHVYVKFKIAESSNNPQKLVELLEEPYIKDDTREQVLFLLSTRYTALPNLIEKALLEVFRTANTLTLKESCLKQLFNTSSNKQWIQSGLQVLAQTVRTRDVHFCALLEKTSIPLQWSDLEIMRMQILNECRVINSTIVSSSIR